MTPARSTPDDLPTAAPPTAGAERDLGPKAARTRSGDPTITVGIVGATGYAGGELVRLLLHHPNVRLAGLYGRNRDHSPSPPRIRIWRRLA